MNNKEFFHFCVEHNLDFETEEKKLISRLDLSQKLAYKMDRFYWHPDFYNKWKRVNTGKFTDNII